ncbi:hypothetical protein K469DRAFT_694041 [Zopfia rhizophila CBS 207.26]|uniref:Uncharacterized protein n=1 Tax=Zopfia rhizophila CBS 207.26 TaxID=1314779 RepID=A0A6A6DJM5_9PEZI|nr:hypothetical protein K469DRAFT_694041 [Zopfia rhizophila CBS 207.26]
MRYVFLDSNTNEPLLSHARARMREEEFVSSVRAFLSLLAVAEAEDLDYVQSKLLPHRLSFYRGPPASPAREIPQATPDESLSHSHTTEDAQPSDALPAIGGWQSRPVGSALRLTAPETADSRYLRSVKRLDSLYGGRSAHGLKNTSEIIELGDSFLREDAVSFIESFRHGWGREGLWYRLPLSNPTTDSSIVERMLNSLRCAETVEHDSAVDPVRLRMARIFLYHYFEEKRINVQKDPNLPNLLSQGRNISSVVLDVILEDMYGRHDKQVSLRVREWC